MDFIPDESAINTEAIEVDKDTMDMLRSLNMAGLPGVTMQQVRGGGAGGQAGGEGEAACGGRSCCWCGGGWGLAGVWRERLKALAMAAAAAVQACCQLMAPHPHHAASHHAIPPPCPRCCCCR